jgi:hypothetical protein
LQIMTRLASRRRGRASNRRLAATVRAQALALVCAQYADFGPTFAHQQLAEEHGLVLSIETLRGWLIAAGSGCPASSAPAAATRPGRAGRVSGSPSRSTAPRTPGSKTAGPSARRWCRSTTPPAD